MHFLNWKKIEMFSFSLTEEVIKRVIVVMLIKKKQTVIPKVLSWGFPLPTLLIIRTVNFMRFFWTVPAALKNPSNTFRDKKNSFQPKLSYQRNLYSKRLEGKNEMRDPTFISLFIIIEFPYFTLLWFYIRQPTALYKWGEHFFNAHGAWKWTSFENW